MRARNLDWFYKAPSNEPDICNLPEYLELYYQLFKENFIGKDDIEKRFAFISWLFSAKTDQFELGHAYDDDYINEILDNSYFPYEIFPGISLTKFHFYYYKTHENEFLNWGIDIKSEEGKKKLILWFLKLNITDNYFPYLRNSYKKYMEISKKYSSKFFDITKIFEVFIDGYDLIEGVSNSDRSLMIAISTIIFNYSMYQYKLTDNQLIQLRNIYNDELLFELLLRIYIVHSKKYITSNSTSSIDVHPELTYLLGSALTYNDTYVYDLLDRWHMDVTLSRGLYLSKFHYYYYLEHEQSFNSWGINIDTEKGRNDLFMWYLKINPGIEEIGYLEYIYPRYLEVSKLYSYSEFDITRIFEIYFHAYELIPDKCIDQDDIIKAVSDVLFNYSAYYYQLTNKQLNQLSASYDGEVFIMQLLRLHYGIKKNKKIAINELSIDAHPYLLNMIEVSS